MNDFDAGVREEVLQAVGYAGVEDGDDDRFDAGRFDRGGEGGVEQRGDGVGLGGGVVNEVGVDDDVVGGDDEREGVGGRVSVRRLVDGGDVWASPGFVDTEFTLQLRVRS